MTLEHDARPAFEVIASREIGREWNLSLRRDRVRWPDGSEADYRVVEGPDAAFVVPFSQAETTVLVRQWRHQWGATAWEVPAGTLEAGEDPLAGARRERAGEAGNFAARWGGLGGERGGRIISERQTLLLARGLQRGHRAPQPH